MVALPRGWGSDYDGQRWFYTYWSTGHVQYRFPKEGDEFPEDASMQPPHLLESQQQVRRQTGSSTSEPAEPQSDSAACQEGGEAEGDVSPPNEDEDEAAKRVVVEDMEERVDGPGGRMTVSPVGSGSRTMPRREVLEMPTQEDATVVTGEPAVESRPHATEGRPAAHDQPPQAFDPVGVVAEMPTEDTVAAHTGHAEEPQAQQEQPKQEHAQQQEKQHQVRIESTQNQQQNHQCSQQQPSPVHGEAAGGISDGKALDQRLSHTTPATSDQNGNSSQGLPQTATPAQPQSSSRPGVGASQEQGTVFKLPAIIKAIRERRSMTQPEPQAPPPPNHAPVSGPVPGPLSPNGGAPGWGHAATPPTGPPTSTLQGPGQPPARLGIQRYSSLPDQFYSQGPPPAGPQAYVPYHGLPGGHAPFQPCAPWQVQQPLRLASVMPGRGYGQYGTPNPWPRWHQQMPPGNAYGQQFMGQMQYPPPPLGQIPPQRPPHVQSAQPQSHMATWSPHQNSPVNTPQGPPGLQQQPALASPPLSVHHASTLSPRIASPTPQGQPLWYPVQTPSPIEELRGGSSNHSLGHGGNGTGKEPSPLSGSPSLPPQMATQGAGQGVQGPPVPKKVPLEHAAGPFSPLGNPDEEAGGQSQGVPETPLAETQQSSALSSQHPHSEYPTGHQVSVHNHGQRPSTPTNPATPPQSGSAQQQAVQTSQPPHPESSARPGHPLGRIQEHHEAGAVSELESEGQGSRPSSIASSLQQAPQVQRQSFPRPQGQGSIGSLPPEAGTPSLGAGEPLQQDSQHISWQTASGAPQQQPLPLPPTMGHTPPGMLSPQAYMPPPGPIQPQGQMYSPGFVPPGQAYQQQSPWNVSMRPHAHPQGIGPLPSPGMTNTPVKEKEKKWTRWFKSSKSSQNSKPQQQVMHHPPGQMHGPGYPNHPPFRWSGGQLFQAPNWQSAQPMNSPPPAGFHPGMHPQFGPGLPTSGHTSPGMTPPGQGPVPPQGRSSTPHSASASTIGPAVGPQHAQMRQEIPNQSSQPSGSNEHPQVPTTWNPAAKPLRLQGHAKSYSTTSVPVLPAPLQDPSLHGPIDQDLVPVPLFANSNAGPSPGGNEQPALNRQNAQAGTQG